MIIGDLTWRGMQFFIGWVILTGVNWKALLKYNSNDKSI